MRGMQIASRSVNSSWCPDVLKHIKCTGLFNLVISCAKTTTTKGQSWYFVLTLIPKQENINLTLWLVAVLHMLYICILTLDSNKPLDWTALKSHTTVGRGSHSCQLPTDHSIHLSDLLWNKYHTTCFCELIKWFLFDSTICHMVKNHILTHF